MEEELPLITVILSILILASYLFTSSNLKYYEYLFGFVPSRPTLFSLLSYTFIHVDIIHLAGNLVVLIIAGLAIEKHVGKMPFISIYLASGCIAAIFDVLSRLLLGIPTNLPFVGASGAIFGLIAVASLAKPMEKIPTILIAFTLLPLIELGIGLPMFADEKVFFTVMILSSALVAIAIYILPRSLPVFIGTLLFIFSWIIFLAFNLPTSTSNIGHLGGLIGGFICMFAFPRTKT